MVSSRTWVLTLKALFLSAGVASVAAALKVSVPLVLEFAVSQLPVLWISLLSWLRPPYLYVVINGIIISIAASTKLHRSQDSSGEMNLTVEGGIMEDAPPPLPVVELIESTAVESSEMGNGASNDRDEEKKEEEEEFMISRSTWTPAKRLDSASPASPREYLPPPSEKPLATARFVHRKPVKSSPEGGKALKVTRPKRHETLENTWKTITEGRPMPLTRHLKKSDTWENHGRHANANANSPDHPAPQVKKSETFNFRDRTNEQLSPAPSPSPSTLKLRKEASPSQDELNRRVEAFIRKFNEEMRMQRQESLNHYSEMMNRGL